MKTSFIQISKVKVAHFFAFGILFLFANTIQLKAQNVNGNGNNGNGNGTNWLPNNGNVGVGTLQPAYKLDVVGNSKFSDDALFIKNVKIDKDLSAGTIYTQRIKSIILGDSLIHFGDSSVIINHVNNRIYASISPNQPVGGGTYYRGFSVGATNNSYGYNSFSMGNHLITKSGTKGNIILGSGIENVGSGGGGSASLAKAASSSFPFINDKDHCLMVGFLSTQPTFYVGPNMDSKDNNGYGYVGIATKNPIARLDVNGGPLWTTDGWYKSIKIGNTNAVEMQGYEVKWGMGAADNDNWYLFHTKTEEQTDAAHYVLSASNNGTVTVHGNLNVAGNITGGGVPSASQWLNSGSNIYYNSGNVGIGIANPTNKFEVCGTIRGKEVIVESNGWCDFVFDENYNLPSFEKRIEQVLEQKHLPNMPTAEQVEASGAEVGITLKALLQNLEEAYLYMNELNKKIEALEKQNKELNKK